jgi:uncharacterized protein YdhG (YjbR/CyaY superfamily)
MQSKAITVNEYIVSLDSDRQEAMEKLRAICNKKLKGFEEQMAYGMLTYVVPHSTYPAGYHCDPKQALPFVSIASQKNFVAVYHMGIYGSPELLDWFTTEFPKHSSSKLDMGKSCIRFKKMSDIPYKLIEQLMGKMTAKQWITAYENAYVKTKKK